MLCPALMQHARFVSDATLNATRDLPRTPSGQNAFGVMEFDLTKDTTTEMLTKHFKTMAVKCHPDRAGGSNEKMSELNAAHKICKENLNAAIDKLAETKRARSASAEYTKVQQQRANREEEVGRTGGIYSSRRVNVARQGQNNYRNAKELQDAWDLLRTETTDAAQRVIFRFEVAMEQCLHFKKLTMLHEISIRERWLRRMFVKAIWEQVHEMRQELLRKGARSQQQAALAEEMVAFATATERKLTEDFHRQSQVMIQGQAKVIVTRATSLFITFVLVMVTVRSVFGIINGATFSSRYKKAFFAVDTE